ncbi:hypothetical protein TPHA_0A06010 [Tetrapisispora phaffii CBS 4417]|uniref:DUF155 domain-containing protein n=1 Tax=Tetrapisispora phaffii (strain ATCC 24235 / CBS 4417 / NBRC 1672 / NRRL Y-8282 / UCD 70-5) TaxID=1071381 RepID=G8BP47_TETPH|nr:hypothetical protein TPHA_0A06010 [Tetrapisispora phaffii CBS 4417]CCE61675.1 hypothetical protein TPHA_0A06010 [Tetrapisispora phaffii CBS 4417]
MNYSSTESNDDSTRYTGTRNASSSFSKRSPSILVTDSRSNRNRINAPFARHAAGLRDRNSNFVGPSADSRKNSSNGVFASPKSHQKLHMNNKHDQVLRGRFSGISVDNILSDSSDVPSGRREERRSSSSWDRLSVYEKFKAYPNQKKLNHLPSRTSKTSQKLVLIPEDIPGSEYSSPLSNLRQKPVSSPIKQSRINSTDYYDSSKIRPHNQNYDDLPRLTAYNIADALNLKSISKFLKETHEVSSRLYNECLYVAYTLPLLSGKDGFRIKSNISKKVIGGKTLIDELIDTSEQRDHHYEYYSGIENPEDASNNYELEANGIPAENDVTVIPDHLPSVTNSTDAFNPGDPQYFAEETPSEKKLREKKEEIQINQKVNKAISLLTDEDQHAEIFIFHYGVIVFWNFQEIQEKNILGDVAFADSKNLLTRPLSEEDIEIEQFHFAYDRHTERPSIFNDTITLRSGDHIMKLTLSHAIAQSSKLSRFESRVTPILHSITKLPKRLALYGTLGLKREQLLKRSGKLFKLRVDVNLSSSVLDTPEFFWSLEPSLHPLYIAMREYLEIDQRVQVLNDRCMVFLEFFDICVDSVAERSIVRVTWWFVFVIIICVIFSLIEIFIRYILINKK